MHTNLAQTMRRGNWPRIMRSNSAVPSANSCTYRSRAGIKIKHFVTVLQIVDHSSHQK